MGRPRYLRILPLRYIPGLKRFYKWLIDDCSQPVPKASLLFPPNTVGRDITTEKLPRPRALEIGCATGNYLVRLQQAGWDATGIEPGVRPASIARDRGLDVYCGMLKTCQLEAASFDMAAAWMVIEHVQDPRDTLQRIHALLKPGGVLLFSIPNAGCWEAKFFGSCWNAWDLPRHLHHFTPESVRSLLLQSGFSDIAIMHQRNLSYALGSLGLVLLARWPESKLGRWLLHYPDNPTVAAKLVLAPMAHMLACLRQGGRLTISARRVQQSENDG